LNAHYQGDVRATASLGFDEVKLDGYGDFMDLSIWKQLLNHRLAAASVRACVSARARVGACSDIICVYARAIRFAEELSRVELARLIHP
jgi:hypothetical protein